MTVFTTSASMATPLMEREPCRGCHHLHRYPLVPKCSCCRHDFRSLPELDRINARRRYQGLEPLAEKPEEEP